MLSFPRSLLALLLGLALAAQEAPKAHVITTTTPDLATLCRAIGGDRVEVRSIVVGPQDPHYLDPRPTFLYAISRAELVVEVGRQLEIGWWPVLLQNGRNPAVLPGQIGHLDASRVVRALGVPTAAIDRTAGDLHMAGNPHYLLDPLCGLEVGSLLRDRCTALWPAQKDVFAANWQRFRERMATAMVGEALAKEYEFEAEKLAAAFGNGSLLDVLKEQGDLERLGGWFGSMAKLRGAKVVVDHDLWPYFAERFGLQVFGFLEPKPGVSPTTAHLTTLAERMRAAEVRVVLASSYFPPQHAAVLERAVGAVVVPMAHQAGARPGTDDYIAFVDYNVKTLASALAGKPAAK